MACSDEEALIEEARALDASARRNKRAADRHRKAAQADRAKQAEIERRCAALGITVTYEHGEGRFHGQRTAARPLHSH